jgi:hypothetical protein
LLTIIELITVLIQRWYCPVIELNCLYCHFDYVIRTMRLREYVDLTSKKDLYVYGDIRIEKNFDLFVLTLEELHSSGRFLFRGMPEAKYKLYNSAQRLFITKELYKISDSAGARDLERIYISFINNLIAESKVWNGGTVSRLLRIMGINDDNSLAYLSFMQHSGIPSPLLDFTYDPFIALFFAIDLCSHYPSDNVIDNYISIYALATDTAVTKYLGGGFDANSVDKETSAIPYLKVADNPLHLIENSNPVYGVTNNFNIINQQGAFMYNSDPFLPLGEHILKHTQEMHEYYNPLDKGNFMGRLMVCYNIHKSLVPKIKYLLEDKGITREYLFPKIDNVTEAIVGSAVRKLSLESD